MAYLAPSDYGDVRLLLGLAVDDTTWLPDATIESRLYLPYVERLLAPILVLAGVTLDPLVAGYDDDVAENVKTGECYLVAARIAAHQRVAGQGEEIISEDVGPVALRYRAPADWGALAVSLHSEGVGVLAGALGAPADTLALSWDGSAFVALAGPSRREATAGAETVADALVRLEPFILRGGG